MLHPHTGRKKKLLHVALMKITCDVYEIQPHMSRLSLMIGHIYYIAVIPYIIKWLFPTINLSDCEHYKHRDASGELEHSSGGDYAFG